MKKLWLVILIFGVSSFSLSSCAKSEDSGANLEELRTAALSASEEDISAAYKDMVAGILKEDTVPFVHEVLADGYVSDAEYEESTVKMKSCLESYGFTDVRFGKDGSFALNPPEGWEEEYTDHKNDYEPDENGNITLEGDTGSGKEDPSHVCDVESGFQSISGIYSQQRFNPLNVNFDELTVQCLIDADVVEKGFTVTQLKEEEELGVNSHVLNSSAYHMCVHDPMGMMPPDSSVE